MSTSAPPPQTAPPSPFNNVPPLVAYTLIHTTDPVATSKALEGHCRGQILQLLDSGNLDSIFIRIGSHIYFLCKVRTIENKFLGGITFACTDAPSFTAQRTYFSAHFGEGDGIMSDQLKRWRWTIPGGVSIAIEWRHVSIFAA